MSLRAYRICAVHLILLSDPWDLTSLLQNNEVHNALLENNRDLPNFWRQLVKASVDIMIGLWGLPCDAKKARSCKKPLNGASPVPGPIMRTGTIGSLGNLNVDLLINAGSLSPHFALQYNADNCKYSIRQIHSWQTIRRQDCSSNTSFGQARTYG